MEIKLSPVMYRHHKIPYATLAAFRKTLDHLEKIKVISRVTRQTAWIDGVVIAQKKDGSL